jgi:hypothetical protein
MLNYFQKSKAFSKAVCPAIITEISFFGQTVAVMNATHAAWRSSGQ